MSQLLEIAVRIIENRKNNFLSVKKITSELSERLNYWSGYSMTDCHLTVGLGLGLYSTICY